MSRGWRYRFASVLGVSALVSGLLVIANTAVLQTFVTTYVPPFTRLEPTVLTGGRLWTAVGLSVLLIGGSLLPLYKPQPSRVLDTVVYAQKRVVVGGLALAALGYFEWSSRLPRTTLALTVGGLLVVVPLWFVWIRRRPRASAGRTLLVGDDREQMRRVTPMIDTPVVGYLSPSRPGGDPPWTDGGLSVVEDERGNDHGTGAAGRVDGDSMDGLSGLTRLGGLSRLPATLVEEDVDTVVLAFRDADRGEFFGALDVCHDHGVEAKVHREYADSVLVSAGDVGELVTIDLEPWDPLDHLFKRVFDVVFASVGIVVTAPLMGLLAVAIKLDSPGPILYTQRRTFGLGNTFVVHKFRTMVPEGESSAPSEDDDNGRITRVGRILRTTHLDELPQLWQILLGRMSVVGPRATWVAEEQLLEEDAPAWRKRWFVKPGLTGFAQINGVTSTDPRLKLRYDLAYIRRQSIRFDGKIVIRQLWAVAGDVYELCRR